MQFDLEYMLGLLLDRDFWRACWVVLQLSITSWFAAIAFGFVLALGKQSRLAAVRSVSAAYIWFFRSLPLLVLLVFVYNLPQVFPATRDVLTDPFWAGWIALVLNESAYIAEIHRGGLLAVPKGQLEAGRALGIRYVGTQWHIVLPQAFRVSLPSLANEYVTIVKLTSLVSVISLTEILTVGERLYTQNFRVLETMLAVAFYYVLIVTLSGRALQWLEGLLDVTRRPGSMASAPKVAAPARLPGKPGGVTGTMEARDIWKRYGTHDVLKGVSLKVMPGEVVSIIGPSGSGKTSFIRTLNGLETVTRGEILLNGKPFACAPGAGGPDEAEQMRRIVDVGMVFQSFNLFPHKTVLQNVMLALRFHKRGPHDETRALAYGMLAKVGMSEHAGKYPYQLSGGQQQRVAIARALAMQPSVMLFDEPTSALDPELVNGVLEVIEALARDGMTMVIVTHEMNFAFRLSDRIVFMDQGSILYDGPPLEILGPSADARIRSFLKDMQLPSLAAPLPALAIA
jgi:polar amino acid transport system permease protein